MFRLIMMTLVIASLVVLSCIFVQQHVKALVIRALINTNDTQTSYLKNTIDYNLRNVNISDVTSPTQLNSSNGDIPTLMVDPNSMFISGVFTTHTSPSDSNKSTTMISIPITNVRNDTTTLTLKASNGMTSVPGGTTVNYDGRLDINKHGNLGILQIGPPNKIDDGLYAKIFRKHG